MSSKSATPITLDDELDQMTRDYCDPTLNRYDTGPGADLDDNLQPGAVAASTSKSSHCAVAPAVKIRLKNTRDLTEEGLRQLCRVYGTVLNVYKLKQDYGNTAFVEFSNQSEAGLAIQELNRKLGFQFYPTFAREKNNPMVVDMDLPAPPPPFESGNEDKLIQTIEAISDEENWELTLAPRRIKSGFSIPLKIRFPERSTTATAPFYAEQQGRANPLTRVDARQIFSIPYALRTDHRGMRSLIDTKLAERMENLAKREGVYQVTAKGTIAGKRIFGYNGLAKQNSMLFPDVFCTTCKQRGFFCCSICGTPYCSKHCQHVDYDRHKILCKPEGALAANGDSERDKINGLVDSDEVYLMQEDFRKGSHVVVLSVLSPERVFVRSLDKDSNKEYLQTLSDIAQAGLVAEKLSVRPEPGDICVTMYEPLNIFARVLIINVTKIKTLCVFLEFGLIQHVNIGQLRKLTDDDLKFRKIRVHKVHLKGITEEHGHIDKAMAYLESLIEQPLEMKVQLEAGNLVDAELRTAAGISVNKRINDLIIIPIYKVIESPDTFVDYKTVPHKNIPANQELDVVIINRTTVKLDFRVTLIAYDDLPYLEDLQQKLQSYGRKVSKFTEPYTPRLNELCLVRSMDTWYRAVCLESVGDCRPTVYLCDYGCLMMGKLEELRKIPPSLAMEVRTSDARVAGLEEAAKSGLKIDSEFLDIYLEENERLTVQTSEEAEFMEFEDTLTKEETPMLTVIKVPDLLTFIADRAQCGESLLQCFAPASDATGLRRAVK